MFGITGHMSPIYLETPCCAHGTSVVCSRLKGHDAWGLTRVNPRQMEQKSQHWTPGKPFFSGLFPMVPKAQWCGPLFTFACPFCILFLGTCLPMTCIYLAFFFGLVSSLVLSPPASHSFHEATSEYRSRKLWEVTFFFFLKYEWKSPFHSELFTDLGSSAHSVQTLHDVEW